VTIAANEIANLTLAALAERIAKRELSPVEVTQAYLDRIAQADPAIGAFITLTGDDALERAKRAEREIATDGPKGPLHGIPFATKDIFYTKGVRTTSGSRLEADFVPTRDARAVEVLQDAGAHSIGKAHTVEYAFDPTGRNEHYPTPHNPWRHGHYTGGSSSGSGAAVAAGMVPLALGSDTGGSIRIPSSFCGITGLKPTFGLVSRAGVTPLSWTLDTAGPMAHDALDVALAMNVLVGHDPADAGSVRRAPTDYTRGIEGGVVGLRIGVPEDYITQLVDPEVKAAFDVAVAKLAELGASVEQVSIPELAWGEFFSIVITAEAAALHRDQLRDRPEEFDQRVRLRLEAGSFIPAPTYLKAQQVRALFGKRLAKVYERFDLLAMPTTVMAAPQHDVPTVTVAGHEVNTRDTAIRHTRIFNQNGLPAISAPCGFSSLGLPIGLMLVGKAFADPLVLRATHAYQQATDWHTRRPGA